MKRHTAIFIAALSLAGCAREQATIDRDTPDSGPVVLGACPEAVQGEILVKTISSSPAVKSGEAGDVPYISEQMENVLEEAGSIRYERLFTTDPRFEARTSEEGLDRWWVVSWDGELSSAEVAARLEACKGIEVIECTLPTVEHGTGSVIPGQSVPKEGATAATTPFDDPFVNQMRQWDFNNTGTVGTASSEPGADANVWRAWELCKGSPDVIVGVFDQGVMFNHEDLADNIWVNRGEIPDNGVDDDGNGYVDDIYGWNFVDNNGKINFSSDRDHGTHVAGTISAVNNNGKGVCGIAGGSGNGDGVKIMSLQILGSDESGSGGAGLSGRIRAMKYAADNGAVISQNSWGYGTGKISLETWKFGIYSAYSDAIRYFVKYAGIGADGTQTGPMAGGVMVCSAGNDATPDLLHYPSCDENALSVAATNMTGGPSYFTNYASWVDIAAPGGDMKQNSSYGQIYSTTIAEDGSSAYGYKQGTSMAAPHVSGALALAISYYWGEEHRTGLTPEMLKGALISSSKDVNQYCPEAYKGKMGIGALDTYALLRTVKMMGVPFPDVTLSVGGTTTINLDEYFISTHAFNCSVSDEKVVEATVSRGVLTLKGIGKGNATVTVSDVKAIGKKMKVTVK